MSTPFQLTGYVCPLAPVALLALSFAAAVHPAAANTLCVNPSGGASCYATIGAAVTAASAGDTIQVAQGTYHEGVVLPVAVALMGANAQNTIIDATGQPNGINVDGYNHPGLAGVVISGFTVENANFSGILVTNASDVTISNNNVVNNDKGLVISSSGNSCPNLPAYFQKGEGLDCGEGLMLSGVDHSVLSGNQVTGNAGGMLITDDTGATHNNLITGNSVIRNTQADCGITLPSHSGAGVFQNTISGNNSSYNGGPGVGIFAPGPGSKAYANVVVNNVLVGNGLPGVTMHNHAWFPLAPPVMFNDNVITGNTISANAADEEDAATSGPTGINIYSVAPMTGTVIAQNVIDREMIDIAVNIPSAGANAPPQVQAHLNNLLRKSIGVQDTGTATVSATLNWWGCSGGPNTNGCATVSGSVSTMPWLTTPFQGQ